MTSAWPRHQGAMPLEKCVSLASRMVCLASKSRVHAAVSFSSGKHFLQTDLSLPAVEISSTTSVPPALLVEVRQVETFGEEAARSWPDVVHAKVARAEDFCWLEDDRHFAVQ